jgi:hypothetical protein
MRQNLTTLTTSEYFSDLSLTCAQVREYPGNVVRAIRVVRVSKFEGKRR